MGDCFDPPGGPPGGPPTTSPEPGGGRLTEESSRTSTTESAGLTNCALPLVEKLPINVAVAEIGSNHHAVACAPEMRVMSTVRLVPSWGTNDMTVSPFDARDVATVEEPEPNPEVTTV